MCIDSKDLADFTKCYQHLFVLASDSQLKGSSVLEGGEKVEQNLKSTDNNR